MNILLINHYAGSLELGMEYRPFYMGRKWVKDGHKVTILSASFAHVRKNQPQVSKDFSEEIIEGIRYVWVKTPQYRGNGFARLRNMFVFVFKLMIVASKISRKYKPDVVVASSTYPLDNYPARRIARKSNAKYIYEVHDLWPLSPMELGGYSKWHPFIMIMQNAENYAYKHSHKVVSMLPKTKEYMINHGMLADKFNYIPNGINIEEWNVEENIPEEHLSLLKKLKKGKKEIVAYVGGHAVSNALHVFIEAINLMQQDNVSFVFVGKGAEKDRLINKAKKLGLNNVYFLPPVSKKSIPQLLSFMDVLYIGWNKQPLYRFGISPNKLMDYMMAGKPVLHSVEAGNDSVSESNCGIAVPPENPDKIAEAVIELLNLPENERESMGNNGKQYVIKNHNYTTLAKKMIKIFQAD